MMSKEELKQLKKDVTEIQKKLQELTEDELEQVFGGFESSPTIGYNKTKYVQVEAE